MVWKHISRYWKSVEAAAEWWERSLINLMYLVYSVCLLSSVRIYLQRKCEEDVG